MFQFIWGQYGCYVEPAYKRFLCIHLDMESISRGGSRTPATSKMERFVIIERSILDVAAVLDPPLISLTSLTIVYILVSKTIVSLEFVGQT